MAKKARRKPVIDADAPTEDDKTTFLVRLEPELLDWIRKAAEEAGMSMNQLVAGILRGAMPHLVQGQADRKPGGFVAVRPQKRCVFFGEAGVFLSSEAQDDIRSTGHEPPENRNGEFWFGLDFTGRGVIPR